MNVGGNTAQEQIFAREVCSRFNLEQVRFCNSGTEANIHALAAARAFTKKRKVVTFTGGYHGAVIGFKGGKPEANNVDLDDWVVARYNDLDSARAAIESEGVAAVLVEGMQGSGGGIPGHPEFLQGIQEIAEKVSLRALSTPCCILTSSGWRLVHHRRSHDFPPLRRGHLRN
jgi:glutamate-1-semialdehyde 2,1-aminomutase